ncbi:MAG: BMC domain-containing protein [Phycisphaeraceae bacterium]
MPANPIDVPPPLGVVEISALGAAMVVLDAMDKSAQIHVLQAELNDWYGYVIKITGDSAALRIALQTAQRLAEQMHAPCRRTVIDAPDRHAWPAIMSRPEYQPLIEQDVVFIPVEREGLSTMNSKPDAIGLIETQGFTAVIEAIDAACKAANVEVIGKEKLGGGYITVVIRGDVAAVKAAVEAGRARADGLGKLIAAHVIARPNESVLKLLPPHDVNEVSVPTPCSRGARWM